MSSNRSTTYLIVGIVLIGLNALAFAPYVSDATLDTVRDTVQSSYDDEEDYGDEAGKSPSRKGPICIFNYQPRSPEQANI